MFPADGERAAVVGLSGQYELAARIVLAKLNTLDWIRIADPAVGVADDFQFQAGGNRHALQVKWSQYPGSFRWSELVNTSGESQPLLRKLADAWQRIRTTWDGPLVIHLRSNEHAATTTPRAGTPLAGATVEGPRHFAAFLARAFEPIRRKLAQDHVIWADVAGMPEFAEWRVPWDALRAASGLDDGDFGRFLGELAIHFGPPVDDPLLRPDLDPVNADLLHIAATLQDLVADPERPVQLSRAEFLDRLGWGDRLRYRHPHAFPVPTVYAANRAARGELEDRLRDLPGGYVALVGPAGSGKSTLLASQNWCGKRVIRYYAFVPDAPDPLSGRGEAESFLHDLAVALEEGGLRRSGYGNDLRSQRAVVQDQLERAARRWDDANEVTVIVVDGLDHVPREQRPTRSLLEELPAPASLGDGVFVILGTQTTEVLPAPVREALSEDDRTIDLPPLSAAEVDQLVDAAGLGSWLLPGQRTRLFGASEGHPLALTYLLEDLNDLEQSSSDLAARRVAADAVLEDASAYGREVERRYRGYFQAAGDDHELHALLATVARLRAPVHLDWLATWADPATLIAFEHRAATFFRRDGRVWRFVHNSFRRFLVDETARVGGEVDQTRDQSFHIALADLCADSSDDWALYRDEEIAHRFLGGQHASVLELAAPSRLRDALMGLRPPPLVRHHALLALRAASSIGDIPTYIRMLLLLNELWQRSHVLDDDRIAEAMTRLDPDRALEHLVAGGQLRVSVKVAMEGAAHLVRLGYLAAARDILRATGGLAGITSGAGPFRSRELDDAVANWAEVALHLSGISEVLEELDDHLPLPEPVHVVEEADDIDDADGESDRLRLDRLERNSAAIDARNIAHARCFDLLADLRDEVSLSTLGGIIDAEASPAWRARAQLVRAVAAYEDGDTDALLDRINGFMRIDVALATEASDATENGTDIDEAGSSPEQRLPLSLRLKAAELLVRTGSTDAPEIDELVPLGTAAEWPSPPYGSDGLDSFHTVLALWRLREIRPAATGEVPTVSLTSSDDPGYERFSRALHVVARLEAEHIKATIGQLDPPAITAEAEPVIRLLEVPGSETRDWTGWYVVRGAAGDLFSRLFDLAASSGGPGEVSRLLDRFIDAWVNPDRAGYWGPALQQAVLTAALVAGDATRARVCQWLDRIDGEIAERTDDPHSRSEAWLLQADAWAAACDLQRAEAAVQKAITTALGPGAHDDDRQLVNWLDWLLAAAEDSVLTRSEFLAAVQTYGLRLVAASPEATGQATEAAERLVELTWSVCPDLACAMAEQLCELSVITETEAIQAVVVGAAADHGVPVDLVATVVVELLLPILQGSIPRMAEIVSARGGERIDAQGALDRIADATAVWSLPTEFGGDTDVPATQESSSEENIDGRPATPNSLLATMRQAGDASDSPPGGWSAAVDLIGGEHVSPAIARALLEEASRLQLDGESIGSLAATAARAGEIEAASTALANTLARTPAYGWLSHYDGGSRLKIVGAALCDRHPALAQLAANDLAGVLASGSISGQILPSDLRKIVALFGGENAVAAAWPDVEAYLDVFAPPAADGVLPRDGSGRIESTTETLLQWCALYLGHPVRPLDFGARRVFHFALLSESDAAQRVLASAIRHNGWSAEAALHLLNTSSLSPTTQLLPDLVGAIVEASTAGDGIVRDLARSLVERHQLPVVHPPARHLPDVYRLTLPPLPDRAPPELDARGVPFLDEHDPQQMVAPFDLPLRFVADLSSLEESAVMYRASFLARSNEDDWIGGGHQAHADRLSGRGQTHSYRPWAYMAGRRALGAVIAELSDAGVLNVASDLPAYLLDLVDETLIHVEPQALDEFTPLPWRRPGTYSYDVREWCNETDEAAAVYATAALAAEAYLLAEQSEWKSLEWGLPQEERTIEARHGLLGTSDLTLPTRNAWETTVGGADAYPRTPDVHWTDQELIVSGREHHSDARWLAWLAVHPALAVQLGWIPDDSEPFLWNGSDGSWRARSIRRVRGQLSHRPPAHSYCAEVWQVLLSEMGLIEVQEMVGPISRTLTVKRSLPARPREGRMQDVQANASVEIGTVH